MFNEPARERPARLFLAFWGAAALLAVVAGVFLGVAVQPLLLTFAGVLFGTALRGLAEGISQRLGWRVQWSLAGCIAALAVLTAGAALWVIPSIADEAGELADRVGQGYSSFRETASESPLGRRLLGQDSDLGQQIGQIAFRAAGVLASSVGSLGAMLFVVFIALYVAAAPQPYRHGIIRLVPLRHRNRAGEILDALSSTLRRWLLGRLVSMTAVGAVTAVGLWLLGIPLPLTLGLIAGFLGFVPNIGPIVSSVPALLLAFTVSPMHVLYVAILYLSINLGDGYLLTPWLQKRAVSLPPALILAGQVVIGALWGVLGLALATPLLACLVVLIRELYVKDTLEKGANTGGASAAAD